MPKAIAQARSTVATTSVQRGRIVRQKLLSAATELIPELGWTGVSTRSVAARAGVAPGLVHYHFASLQDLLRAAAIAAVNGTIGEVDTAMEQAPAARQGLAVLLGALDTHTGSDPMSLLFIETYLAATRDDVLRADLTRILTDFRSVLAGWLRELGQEAPDETAAVIAAAIDGVMLHRALDPALTSAVVLPVLRRLLDASAA
jgi:AcrR family transcriptional regulator